MKIYGLGHTKNIIHVSLFISIISVYLVLLKPLLYSGGKKLQCKKCTCEEIQEEEREK